MRRRVSRASTSPERHATVGAARHSERRSARLAPIRNHGCHRVEAPEVLGRRQRLHAGHVPGSVARGAPVRREGRHARAPEPGLRRVLARRRADGPRRVDASFVASGGGVWRHAAPSRAARMSPRARACSSPPPCWTGSRRAWRRAPPPRDPVHRLYDPRTYRLVWRREWGGPTRPPADTKAVS